MIFSLTIVGQQCRTGGHLFFRSHGNKRAFSFIIVATWPLVLIVSLMVVTLNGHSWQRCRLSKSPNKSCNTLRNCFLLLLRTRLFGAFYYSQIFHYPSCFQSAFYKVEISFLVPWGSSGIVLVIAATTARIWTRIKMLQV